MKKVLIAEDSSVIQNLAKKILEFQNFEIHSVKNGQQVLDAMEKEDFDILVWDKHLPKHVCATERQFIGSRICTMTSFYYIQKLLENHFPHYLAWATGKND